MDASTGVDSQTRKNEMMANVDHEINFAGGQKMFMNEEAAVYVAGHIVN